MYRNSILVSISRFNRTGYLTWSHHYSDNIPKSDNVTTDSEESFDQFFRLRLGDISWFRPQVDELAISSFFKTSWSQLTEVSAWRDTVYGFIHSVLPQVATERMADLSIGHLLGVSVEMWDVAELLPSLPTSRSSLKSFFDCYSVRTKTRRRFKSTSPIPILSHIAVYGQPCRRI